jgi:hypothetical protein
MSFAVLLQSHELPPATLVASVLVERAGLPRPVAMRLAGRGKWIVWENAPADPARSVAQALTLAGAPAEVVPQQHVVPSIASRRVHVLHLDGDALGVQLRYSGPPELVAWDDVLVISAGAIRSETTRTEKTETIVGRGHRVTDTRTIVDINRTILADIYAHQADGSLLYIRMNCQEINYAQTIGASVTAGWRDKFALLLARLGLRSQRALVSPQTEALLAAGMAADACTLNPYFGDEDEFALYNRWLATRQRLALGRV